MRGSRGKMPLPQWDAACTCVFVKGLTSLTFIMYTLHRWKLRFLRVKKWSVSVAGGRRDQLSG